MHLISGIESLTNLKASKDCDPSSVKDPNAPCSAELFTDTIQIESLQRTLTCGINVKDAFGNIVAKLWENVTVTWRNTPQPGYDINSAYRYTWVKDWRYGWRDLTGPSPNSGRYSYLTITRVKISGTVTYFGGRWHSYTVYTNITGDETNPRWWCELVQNW